MTQCSNQHITNLPYNYKTGATRKFVGSYSTSTFQIWIITVHYSLFAFIDWNDFYFYEYQIGKRALKINKIWTNFIHFEINWPRLVDSNNNDLNIVVLEAHTHTPLTAHCVQYFWFVMVFRNGNRKSMRRKYSHRTPQIEYNNNLTENSWAVVMRW